MQEHGCLKWRNRVTYCSSGVVEVSFPAQLRILATYPVRPVPDSGDCNGHFGASLPQYYRSYQQTRIDRVNVIIVSDNGVLGLIRIRI